MMIPTSMETAVQHGTWMDEESFKKTCIKAKEKGGDGRHQLLYGTWVAALMLRQDVAKFLLGKYSSNQQFHGSVGDWGWWWQELP